MNFTNKKNKSDLDLDILEKCFQDALKEGKINGLKIAKEILNSFLDKKIKMNGMPEYISRQELNMFMDTYISEEMLSTNKKQ